MKTPTIPILYSLLLFMGCQPEPNTSIVWIEGETNTQTWHATHKLLVVNPPKGTDWDVWGVFPESCYCPAKATDDSQMALYHYDGCTLRLTPKAPAETDTLTLIYEDYEAANRSMLPTGFSIRNRKTGSKARQLPLEYRLKSYPDIIPDSFQQKSVAFGDLIPTVKHLELLSGKTPAQTEPEMVLPKRSDKKRGWYQLTIQDGIQIQSADEDGAYYGRLTLDKLREQIPKGDSLPNLQITDWPDLPIRAFLLDVARHFYSPQEVMHLLDVLARSKMNTLVLHFNEDEAWRLEIAGLPELTTFGAYHDTPVWKSDSTFLLGNGLYPMLDGKIGHDIPAGGSTGFYSRETFKALLAYAHERHIEIIPEFDVPGHMGSAILAMEERARHTGDSTCLLTHPSDISRHEAFGGFRNNVIDVGLQSSYDFIAHVIDDLISIYREAGLHLSTVSMAGDEVPEGCWLGSPAAAQIALADGDSISTKGLWSHFWARVNRLLADRGIRIAGYQEIILDVTEQTKKEICQNAAFIICWHATTESSLMATLPYQLANEGIPVMLSHGNYTYMDNAYSRSRQEKGLLWCGPMDSRRIFSYLPYALPFEEGYEATPLTHPENIVGLEPMLWGGWNAQNFEETCRQLLPKAYLQFDRCWNASPAKTDEDAFARLYSIIYQREIPWLDSKGIAYRTFRVIP